MSGLIDTSLQVQFGGTQPGDGRPLAIDLEPGIGSPFSLRFRVYPPVVERVAVSSGELTREATGRRASFDRLVFSGNDFAALNYWTDKPPAVLYQEVFFSDAGESAAGVSFHWDAERNGYAASEPVHAVLQVLYEAPYQTYLYLFDHGLPLSAIGLYPNVLDVDGLRPSLAIAYNHGRTVTLDLEPPDGEGSRYVELYSVVSDVVVDEDGAWEKPEGYPDNTDFPGGIPGPLAVGGLLSERVHETAAITSAGLIDERRLWVTAEQPFVGSSSYQPAWRLRRGNPPEGFKTIWLDVDWNGLETALQDRYPGIAL